MTPAAARLREEASGPSAGISPDAAQCELALDGGIQARFEQFHHDRPDIYETLVWLARYQLHHGLKRVSMGHLFHLVRWRAWLKVRGRVDHMVKLNDHYTSRYVRLIEQQEPDLRGAFECRNLRSN
jgi:hypothetical protein